MKAKAHRNGLVTVMSGGPSAEREVSLRSGRAMTAALGRLGYRVMQLDPQDDTWTLAPDCALVVLALHGTYGEDGTVQDRLEALGVPYTGCDAASSRLAFDKAATKQRLSEVGVPTPQSMLITDGEAPVPAGWSLPLVVKPVRQGSSVGLGIVREAAQWAPALRTALEHDTAALVEVCVSGRELTVGILGHQALPVVEICPLAGTYDYANKYTSGATRYVCPAELPPEVALRVQQVGWAAFQAVGGRDYGRVDVLLDADGHPWVLEVNTLPGMTETSLLPKAAAAAGLSFDALCERMMTLALERSASNA